MANQDFLSICINDSNPNAFCVIHVELDDNNQPIDWTFEYCNDALAKLEKKTKEELIGHQFYSIFPYADKKWLKHYYEAAYQQKYCKYDVIAEELNLYLNIEVFPAGTIGYCACILRNIKDSVIEKNIQAEKLALTVKKLEEEKELNNLVRDYASAMGVVYPLTTHLDYLHNEYKIMDVKNFPIKNAPITGTVDDFLEMCISTIADQKEVELFREKFNREAVLEAFKNGKKEINLKHRIIGEDKKIHWMNSRVICIHYSSDKIEAFALSRCVDEETEQQRLILEYEKASTAARIAENDYKMLHKLIKSGMWRMYYDKDYNLTKVDWSDDFREMIGYESEEDFPSKLESWEKLIHPEDLPQVLDKMDTFLHDTDGKEDYDVTYRIKTRNRGYRWFRETGTITRREDESPYCFFGVFFDVTDEKERAELEKQKRDALEKANEISKEIETLHQALGSAAWTFKYNHQNQLIGVKWSQSFREILGFKNEAEFPNQLESGVRIIHPDDVKKVYDLYRNVVLDETGNSTYDCEFRALTKDNHYKWFKSIGRMVRREDGTADTFYGLSMDIDEKKKMDDALQSALKDAETASKAKSLFLRNMSHDIRTPINGIVGLIELSERNPEDIEMLKENRRKMKNTTGYLLSLVNNILDASKLEDGNFKLLNNKPFNLNELLAIEKDTLKLQTSVLGISLNNKGIKSEIIHPNVIGSVQHINCVLMNIAGNAVKFNKPNGSINLYTREINYDGTYATYEFICEDTGIGMSEEFQKHMYEPYIQEGKNTLTTYVGAGLGLTLAKEAIEVLGGKIECTSKENVGTTFVMTMKFLVNQDDKANDKNEIQLSGKKVLLVDDNDLNQEIAKSLLEQEGMIVDVAENGKEAIDKFKASKMNEYDVILMDIMMPIVNGLDATKTIRVLNRDDARSIPIIAMTANTFDEDIHRCFEAGMDGHLAKPIDMNKIKKVLQEVL